MPGLKELQLGNLPEAHGASPGGGRHTADDESSETRSTASGASFASSANGHLSDWPSEGRDSIASVVKVTVAGAPRGTEWFDAADDSSAADRTLPSSTRDECRAFCQLINAEAEALMPHRGDRRAALQLQGTRAAVRRQLLADACRGRYFIEGAEFWFEKESATGEGSQSAPGCRSGPCAGFAERLMAAVERCVGLADGEASDGANAHDGFAHVVMLLLTQIGLALAHVACAGPSGPQLALCGGKRTVTYELTRCGAGEWNLRCQFCAHGFSQYQAVPSASSAAMPTPAPAGAVDIGPLPCSTASSVYRGFNVGLTFCAELPAGVHINVEDVYEDVSIFSLEGLPALLLDQCSPAYGLAACAASPLPYPRGGAAALLQSLLRAGAGAPPASGRAPVGLWWRSCMSSTRCDTEGSADTEFVVECV